MLQILTLLPLALALPPADADLLSAIPQGAVFAVHGRSPKALIAARDTSNWVAFALDARWDKLLDDLAVVVGEGEADAEELRSWRRMLMGAMADTTGFVGFFGFDEDFESKYSGLIAHGGEQCAGVLRQMVGDGASTVQLPGGHTALVGEAGRAELFLEQSGLVMLISAPSIEEAKTMATQCLDRLETPGLSGPFALQGLAAQRADADLEAAIDLGRAWDQLRLEQPPSSALEMRAMDALASMGWGYMAMDFDDGEEATATFVAPFEPRSLMGEFFGFFGAAKTELLGHVPSTALQATVAAFDVGGAAAWALELVREASQDEYAQVMAAIEGGGALVGIDIMDDVIGQLTGDFLLFDSADPFKVDGVTVPGASAPTAVFFMEETEALLDVADVLIQLSGLGDGLASDSRNLPGAQQEMELWLPTSDADVSAAVGLGAGRLVVSGAAGSMAAYLDLACAVDGATSVLDDERLAKAVAGAQGAMVSMQATAVMADITESMVGSYTEFMRDLEIDMDSEDLLRDEYVSLQNAAGTFAAMVRQYFQGTTTTTMNAKAGLVTLVTQSR